MNLPDRYLSRPHYFEDVKIGAILRDIKDEKDFSFMGIISSCVANCSQSSHCPVNIIVSCNDYLHCGKHVTLPDGRILQRKVERNAKQ